MIKNRSLSYFSKGIALKSLLLLNLQKFSIQVSFVCFIYWTWTNSLLFQPPSFRLRTVSLSGMSVLSLNVSILGEFIHSPGRLQPSLSLFSGCQTSLQTFSTRTHSSAPCGLPHVCHSSKLRWTVPETSLIVTDMLSASPRMGFWVLFTCLWLRSQKEVLLSHLQLLSSPSIFRAGASTPLVSASPCPRSSGWPLSPPASPWGMSSPAPLSYITHLHIPKNQPLSNSMCPAVCGSDSLFHLKGNMPKLNVRPPKHRPSSRLLISVDGTTTLLVNEGTIFWSFLSPVFWESYQLSVSWILLP